MSDREILNRNHSVEFRVERDTGPFCRATRPTALRTTRAPNGERSSCAQLGGRLPPRTAKLAVPPGTNCMDSVKTIRVYLCPSVVNNFVLNFNCRIWDKSSGPSTSGCWRHGPEELSQLVLSIFSPSGRIDYFP